MAAAAGMARLPTLSAVEQTDWFDSGKLDHCHTWPTRQHESRAPRPKRPALPEWHIASRLFRAGLVFSMPAACLVMAVVVMQRWWWL